jgi:preprotein translocase SecE subunit
MLSFPDNIFLYHKKKAEQISIHLFTIFTPNHFTFPFNSIYLPRNRLMAARFSVQVLGRGGRPPVVSFSRCTGVQHSSAFIHHHILKRGNIVLASSGNETDQPEQETVEHQQIDPPSSSSTATTDSTLSAEEIQQQMGELRRAKQEQEAVDNESLVNGVMEEVQLIQWPTFTSALLNTLLVISIVFGTSVVLFGVNTALTEVSNAIYK